MNETIDALLGYFPWIVPEMVLGVFACVLFVGATFKSSRRLWGWVALGGLGAASVALFFSSLPTFASQKAAEAALYASPVLLDRLAVLIKAVALAGIAVLVLFSWDEVEDNHAAEYHGCLLVIAAGLCFTAGANDLITLFLALELISIPTYVLLYLPRADDAAREAGVKYFLLSIFASALMLFGFSYLYGLAGTTNLQGIADALAAQGPSDETRPAMLLVALIMVVAGMGFKITAVPFHFYAPDVYQGTSTGAAALLAFAPKVAGFAALIRVFGFVPYELVQAGEGLAAEALPRGSGPVASSQLSTLLWIVAAVTMTLGNVLALLQDNLKRLLAYSSVAHAGYMLIGLTVAPYVKGNTVDAVLFYLVAYGAMTIGAFAVLHYLSTPERPVETVNDLAGLWKSHPQAALLMALFMFSLIGIPATAGFVGKFLLFFGAFTDPGSAYAEQATLFRVLAVIAAVNAAIGGWYYLRVVVAMYLRSPLKPLPAREHSPALVAVWLCALVTLAFGLYPKPLKDRATEATNNTVTFAPRQ